MQDKCKELAESGPLSQVVPSGAVAGFVISFAPTEAQDFNERISYTVNGKHTFNFAVTADVGPILCELRPPALFFEFGNDSTEMEVSRSTTIVNTSNAVANYKWSVEAGSAYSVVPAAGSIPPNSSVSAVVTFRPIANAGAATRMTLLVQGGDDVVAAPTLVCTASVDEPKLVFAAKKVRVQCLRGCVRVCCWCVCM